MRDQSAGPAADFRTVIDTWREKFRPHPDGAELPPHHDYCLGCGPHNAHGHHLKVHRHGDAVIGVHTFDDRHVGAPGIVHGGAVATVLDDLYGFLLYLIGVPAVTRQLEVEYLAPVLIGTIYRLEACFSHRQGRKLFVTANLTDPGGRQIATSTALFIVVDVEHFAQADKRRASGS